MGIREEIENISGIDPKLCYSCGTCSSGCPIVEMMDSSPAATVRRIALDDETVLEENTIWLCAACYTCDVRCPRGLKISAIMEAARTILLRERSDHIRPEHLKEEVYADTPPITLIAAFRKYTS